MFEVRIDLEELGGGREEGVVDSSFVEDVGGKRKGRIDSGSLSI